MYNNINYFFMPSLFARFRAIEEKDKAAVVRKLMQSSTPNFDFFYLVGLSVFMATLGLLADSPSIVIGSMLIAPILYPILGIALGLSMSNIEVLGRSTVTLAKSIVISLGISVLATLLFGDGFITGEMIARLDVSTIHFLVAVVAGAAVSFALAQPEWSETLPGIAISVALIPPLAVLGSGIAMLDMVVVSGAFNMLLFNFLGILLAAVVTFSLMNLHEKQSIAESTIRQEEEKQQKEQEAIAAVVEESNGKHEHKEEILK